MLNIKARAKRVMTPREIAVDRGGGKGLSSSEVDDALKVIRAAKAQGKLPAMTYEYNPHTRIFGKDPLYLKPKSADLRRTAVKVRTVLRAKYGSKYFVHLV